MTSQFWVDVQLEFLSASGGEGLEGSPEIFEISVYTSNAYLTNRL